MERWSGGQTFGRRVGHWSQRGHRRDLRSDKLSEIADSVREIDLGDQPRVSCVIEVAYLVPSPRRTWILVVGFDESTSNLGWAAAAEEDGIAPGTVGVAAPLTTSGAGDPSRFPPPANACIGFLSGG